MKKLTCLYSLFAIGTLLAADWPRGTADKHAYLEIALANKTPEQIDEAGVYFGEFRCTKGILGAGASGTYLGWQRPITTNAIIRWRDAHKIKQEKTINLGAVYKPKVDGLLTFSIGTTNVTVTFETIDRK
jgi:hypothetical protein